MISKPEISILIANFNNGKYFKDCYESLITQTNSDWEAIIVDDASNDNSVEIIMNLIKDDSRFKLYINEINLGYQKTLVKCLELSNAGIFGRLDPDDALVNNSIELSLLEHFKNPNVGLVYSNKIICNDKLEKINVEKGVQVKGNEFLKGEISHFATFKKSFYNRTTGFDISNKRAEDKDIYMKFMEIGEVKYIDHDLYLYRIHNNSLSTFDNIDKSYFWYWVALIKAAERRGVNLENEFLNQFVRKYKYTDLENKYNKLLRNRWVKLGLRIGLIRNFN